MGIESMDALLAKWRAEDKASGRLVERATPSDWWQAIKRAGKAYAERQGYENAEEFLRWLYDQFMAGRKGAKHEEEKKLEIPVEHTHAAKSAPDD